MSKILPTVFASLISLALTFAPQTSKADTVTLTGIPGINGQNGINPGDPGTAGGAGGAATAGSGSE